VITESLVDTVFYGNSFYGKHRTLGGRRRRSASSYCNAWPVSHPITTLRTISSLTETFEARKVVPPSFRNSADKVTQGSVIVVSRCRHPPRYSALPVSLTRADDCYTLRHRWQFSPLITRTARFSNSFIMYAYRLRNYQTSQQSLYV